MSSKVFAIYPIFPDLNHVHLLSKEPALTMRPVKGPKRCGGLFEIKLIIRELDMEKEFHLRGIFIFMHSFTVQVNDTPMSNMSHAEAVAFLRACGSEVRLRLYRDHAATPLSPMSPKEEPTDSDAPLNRPKPPLR